MVGGVAVLVVGGILVGVVSGSNSAPAQSASGSGAAQAPANPGPGGPGQCPVGTSATALKIANALAGAPVYVEPGSALLTSAQVAQLETEIAQADAGRIRIAAVTPATVSQGSGERSLANAIASCQADAAGTMVLTTNDSTYLVTSYADDHAATSAVGAALNTHANLGAGLLDAVHRIATVDKASH